MGQTGKRGTLAQVTATTSPGNPYGNKETESGLRIDGDEKPQSRLGILRCIPSLLGSYRIISFGLTLADFEHLGAANRADTLCGRPPILHDNTLCIPHLSLGSALHTIGLHQLTSFFKYEQ